jgi:hypothetical protein
MLNDGKFNPLATVRGFAPSTKPRTSNSNLCLSLLSERAAGHVALAEVVLFNDVSIVQIRCDKLYVSYLNGSLACCSGLRESS